MTTPLLHQIVIWLNGIFIAVFVGIEIFWFTKQKFIPVDLLSLLGGFFFYNLPFLLLAISMWIQPAAAEWSEILRLSFLTLAIPINLWLHYHGDKGANSVGMLTIFFLMAAVPLIVVIEILIAVF